MLISYSLLFFIWIASLSKYFLRSAITVTITQTTHVIISNLGTVLMPILSTIKTNPVAVLDKSGEH